MWRRINSFTYYISTMPIIRIDFDDEVLGKDDIVALSKAIQKIIAEVTHIEDVFVYANSAQIKLNIAPIEIFVEMSAHIFADEDKMIWEIKQQISTWKNENRFSHPINLTIIPMKRKMEIWI